MSADQGGSQQQQEGNRASHHLSSDEMKATIKAKRDEIHAKESKCVTGHVTDWLTCLRPGFPD
jgi:hypothetical protein